MRGKNLIKLLKALNLFSKPEGTTIEEMRKELEIDRRSVYRVIGVVEDLGFPVYDEKIDFEREKRWKLEEFYLKKLPNIKIPDVNLTLPEIISLYLLGFSKKSNGHGRNTVRKYLGAVLSFAIIPGETHANTVCQTTSISCFWAGISTTGLDERPILQSDAGRNSFGFGRKIQSFSNQSHVA